MAERIVSGNSETRIVAPTSNFPECINDALQDCQDAHNLLLTISNEANEIPSQTSSSVRNYCAIGVHLNNALQGSIRGIGYGGNIVNRLRTVLNPEQRDGFANDLHGMQNEMVTTYTELQAADTTLWRSLRQAVQDDPLLCDDTLAIQCVDEIEENHNHLQSLPVTPDSLRERSDTMQSIHSQLNLLEERVEHINPRSPLAKLLKIFHKAFKAINHLMKGVIRSLYAY